MSEQTYSTYALVDPITTKVRYVGMTKNLKQRYTQHRKQPWIQELLKKGMSPILDILDADIALELAKEREQYWIHKFEGEGHALENVVYNECAIYARQEEADLQARLEKEYSYLPKKQSDAVIQITKGAYDHVGVCAWEDAFSAALFTVEQLEEDGIISPPIDEVQVAIITLRRWKLVWNGEEAYNENV